MLSLDFLHHTFIKTCQKHVFQHVLTCLQLFTINYWLLLLDRILSSFYIFYFGKDRIHKAGFNILPYYVAETIFILAIYSRNVFKV